VTEEQQTRDEEMRIKTRAVIAYLNKRTPEQKVETALRMDARVSALLGLPLEGEES